MVSQYNLRCRLSYITIRSALLIVVFKSLWMLLFKCILIIQFKNLHLYSVIRKSQPLQSLSHLSMGSPLRHVTTSTSSSHILVWFRFVHSTASISLIFFHFLGSTLFLFQNTCFEFISYSLPLNLWAFCKILLWSLY